MPKITPLFAHPVYEVDFPNYLEIQESLVNYIRSTFNSEVIDHRHDHPLTAGVVTKIYDKWAYHKEGKTINDTNLQLLFDWITVHGKEYWKILNLSENLNPYILQLIGTETSKGGFLASHNHNPVPIAGAFYLQASPNSGNLFLENPLDLVLGKSPRHGNKLAPTRLNYEIEAVSGKLVLFPGWMKHFTRPNPTDDVRMSMAVNFGCEGQVYVTEFG